MDIGVKIESKNGGGGAKSKNRIKEKSVSLQKQYECVAFIDLTNVFDLVSRRNLFRLLRKRSNTYQNC